MDKGFELVKKTIRVANSSIGFDDRLQGILDLLGRWEGISRAVLFSFSLEQQTLELKKLSPRDLSWEGRSFPLIRSALKDALENRRPLIIPHLNRKEHKVLLKNPFFKGVASLTVLPVEDENFVYGALGLLSRASFSPTPHLMEELDLVARELAGIIRNSRIYTESKKRIADLSVLHEVGKVIGSTLELDDLIKRTVAITAQVINATGSALMILDKDSETVIVDRQFGQIPSQIKEQIFSHILGKAGDHIYNRESAVVSKIQGDRTGQTGGVRPSREKESIAPFMSIALHFKGPYCGRLCVYGKKAFSDQSSSPFLSEDLSVLYTIGNIIASSLENALTFQQVEALANKNQEMVRNLSTLYQIDSALMTTASLKELPQIILEALTSEVGLGFSRAILLLADEEKKFLTPVAWSVQKQTDVTNPLQPPKKLTGQEMSRFLILQASRIRETRSENDPAISKIRIPLTNKSGIIARTYIEGRPFLIDRAQEDPRTNKDLVSQMKLDSFASIPMYAKDKVIGVIEVDNFISKRPITEEDLSLLSMLAHQAGLALENARLYDFIEKTNQELKAAQERLIESEKLVAIGEMASGLAHEIRNPLVSIGGFARRLLKKFQDDDVQVQSYSQVIITEVERLEKTLNEILDFSQDPRGKYKGWDLNRILEKALNLLQGELDIRKIAVQKEWGKLPLVFGDNHQLRHVFYNLFLNSCQAMPQGGVLTLRTYVNKGAVRSWIVCEVKDTGGGIPLELLHNIFNPFFTTKAQGSGLGLSIVHKIITRHQGEVAIDNRPGEGVSFLIKFPVLEESRSNTRKNKTNGEDTHEKNTNR